MPVPSASGAFSRRTLAGRRGCSGREPGQGVEPLSLAGDGRRICLLLWPQRIQVKERFFDSHTEYFALAADGSFVFPVQPVLTPYVPDEIGAIALP